MAKVLMVDDSKITLKKMIHSLGKDHNYEVVTAFNGQEALGIVKADSVAFDLIITDLHMPLMDGFQLVEALVSHGVSAPIVVCSADQQNATAERVIELGAKEILSKPSLYGTGALESLIEKYVHPKAA